jgi:N-acetylmuramoyl-L-alanine amidase
MHRLFPLPLRLLAGVCGALTALPAQTTAPPDPAEPVQRLARLSPLGQKPDWPTLQAYQLIFTRDEFDTAWHGLYSAESGLPAPLRILPEAVEIPTGRPTEPVLRIAFRDPATPVPPEPVRSWRRVRELPPLQDRPVLSDLRIALDPGHIGGAWARMEERYLSFQPGEAIQEGDLSLTVARVLAERLTALGAEVTLVREHNEPVTELRPDDLRREATELLQQAGIAQPTASYEGLDGSAKAQTVQWQAEKLFYRVSEIHARAEKVNERIRPDLVLCLHLNAEAWGRAEAPQFSPENHLHVLVNGCYAPTELEQADIRYEMFSRLFQRIHEEEVPLAEAVAKGLALRTRLPAYVYTTPNARRAGNSPYVYARNLLANRIYQCPVVYLEPFVMNHEATYRRLLRGHWVGRTLIDGQLQSSALEDYVRGVVDGLVAYYQNRRP